MTIPPFHNEPALDFGDPGERQAMEAALSRMAGRLGEEYPLVIGGRRVRAESSLESLNPAHPGQVVGRHSAAQVEHVEQALAAGWEAFASWSRTPVAERAAILLRAAELVRRRRRDLAAVMVYEVGKPWDEADGEAAEAVDLMEWYARQALQLAAADRTAPLAGEMTEFRYLPLGVGAVISPWNFPVALTTGMTTAAVVAGNCVVLKPANTACTTACFLVQLWEDAGVPKGVINLLTGRGSVIGDLLVDHPQTRFVAFTGSREVGIRINERAARVHPGQRWLKRVQLEMGGKNAVVVDETADLELAAREIAVSAFSFQGQKCSAGSRAVVVRSVYDELVPLVLDRVREIRLGDPVDPAVTMGPVVDAAALEKILDYVELGKREGELLLGGSRGGEEGYFVEPTVFGGVRSEARIAQEEIFGPVLALMPAGDIDDAIEIANSTEYGLTGSFFSRDRRRLAAARDRIHVGNLYFNRKSTGALMGVHPFGGFNMSGTDTKAGGPDYLLFFLQGQSLAERL